MTRTIVDIHVLQTVPPSNINRDDTGSPKTAVFGGVRRARVSSQAWKRATRRDFDDLLDRSDLGVRTKRVVELVIARVLDQRPDLAEAAPDLAAGVLKSTGIQTEKATRTSKAGEKTEALETKYLVFLSNLQIDQLARAVIDIADAEDSATALKEFKGKKVLDRDHSVDLALFGRMVADSTDLNVDACAQVAHAISVHAVDNEFDYFTAVDDEKERAEDEEDSGAGMIGTVEFNSSTLYRYATVDVDGLKKSLGDAVATRRAVEAFVTAFITSMPSGKQNTFANRTLPDAIMVSVRKAQPVNLVGAFEVPVVTRLGESRSGAAATLLAERAVSVSKDMGQTPVATWTVAIGAARPALDAVAGLTSAEGHGLAARTVTLPDLAPAVGALVSERLGDS